MPKFARPNAYNGKQGNQSWTGQSRFANADEAAAGEADNLAISPLTLASAVGGLVPSASATVEGVVFLTEGTSSIAYPVATKFYADNLAIAGAPAWSETVSGIGQLATQAEVNAGTDDNTAVTPLKLATLLGGGSGPGSFTDLTATGAVTFTGATGALSMTSTSASSLGVTGAGIDLTLSSSGGRVVVNGEEAAADALRLLSAAGGLDVDVALQMSLVSSQNAADAIVINASAGGIDLTAAGAAGEDIDLVCTAGSINLTAGESAADSIKIVSSIGGIQILASGAAAAEDIVLTATGSSIRLVSTESAGDAVYLESTLGGVQILASGAAAGEDIVITATGSSVHISSTESAADAIVLSASAGGIDILAPGAAAGEDIDIVATGSSVNIQATESDVNAITINASGAAGGINVDAGTNGFILDTTGAISLDAAAASNFTATGAFDVTVSSTAGSINISGGEAAADALNFDAAAGGLDVDVALQMNLDSSQAAVNAVRIIASGVAGGIDVDAGTGGITIDTTGALSLDSAAASNFTVTGAFALDVITTLGKLSLQSGQSAADSIEIKSLIGGIDILAAGAAAGEDIDIVATGSSVNISSSESAVDSITIVSSAGGIDILASGAAAGEDIDIVATGSSVNISATESAVDSITIVSTAGGIDILASGAAAGEDIDIVATGSSVNISATENVADAIVINASGAASGMSLDCGTASLTIGTGMKHAVTSVATAASPYAVLGTDYFITTDSTGGALTITLPAVPGTGRKVVVYDGAGQAAAGGNITIDGNGNNIAAAGTSAATKLINTAYESYILTFNGTLWCGQNIV